MAMTSLYTEITDVFLHTNKSQFSIEKSRFARKQP